MLRVDAPTYERLPEHLQRLFYLVNNSDEVVAAFPAERPGKVGMTQHASGTNSVYGKFERSGQSFVQDGVDDSGSAARFFFSAKAGAQDRWGSRHPTVKPVELMKWLVALVCPPGGTVLDPFAGSGTTAVAALGTGRNAILIEREDQYVADIRERVAFYEGGGAHSVQAKNRSRKTDHGPLFDPAAAPLDDCQGERPNTEAVLRPHNEPPGRLL